MMSGREGWSLIFKDFCSSITNWRKRNKDLPVSLAKRLSRFDRKHIGEMYWEYNNDVRTIPPL